MRAIRNEKGVLKLVHPGRHVEIHREPIIASEIMRRNPRHCVTRPDVFQFPWIVVKPESILLPGRVFFIVPYHTIYDLIKSKVSSQNQQFSHDHSLLMCSSDIISTNNRQTQKHLFTKLLPWKMYRCVTAQKQSRVEVWPKGMNRYKEKIQMEESEKHSQREESNAEIREDSGKASSTEKDVDLDFVCEQVTMLKSCLRKPDSIRRLLNLKVSFDLPDKEEKQMEYSEVLQIFLGVEISDTDTSKH